MGLRDYDELDEMISQFAKDEDVDIVENIDSYSYEDILGITFKLINSSDCYEYDSEYKIWRDKSENTKYMKKFVKNGEDLKIVGVVQPKEGVTATMLQTGIYYPASLTSHIIEKAADSKIVKAQLKSPEINVFTGKKFDEDKNEDNYFEMNSLFEIDEKAIKSAFKIDESKIKVDLGNLNEAMNKVSLPPLDLNKVLSELKFSISSNEMQKLVNDLLKGYEAYMQNHPGADFSQINKQLSDYLQSKEASELLKKEIEDAIKENEGATITEAQMQEILTKLLKGYEEYVKQNNLVEIADIEKYLIDYLQSNEAEKIIADNLSEIIKSQNLDKQISAIMEKYMKTVMTSMSKTMEKEITASMKNLSKSMANAFSFDGDAFANAIHMKMDEEELSELMASLMSKQKNTYEGNLKKLNYANFEEPDGINIFPKNFEGNEAIIKVLDDYNSRMREEGSEDKVISYTDMVGTLMNSVTTIVDVISYVLVAFVAISLIVSSIMIGVITYISVLERKKEIGILRAIGASKHNISQIFNAETLMIGLLAGIIGIGITLLLLIPINQIIHSIAGNVSVTASLPAMSGIILIILSTILTLIGGIIPSRKAAKEDPVLALRSE